MQAAVRFARAHELRLGVRSSGHSYNCDAFQADALQLDLRGMKATRVEGLRARMEPGASFATMAEAIPSGYSFTQGTCDSVGIMGYSLHGGWGATTSTWANESIVEMEVITADGELHTLNASSQGDEAKLWNAMRVAGSSVSADLWRF